MNIQLLTPGPILIPTFFNRLHLQMRVAEQMGFLSNAIYLNWSFSVPTSPLIRDAQPKKTVRGSRILPALTNPQLLLRGKWRLSCQLDSELSVAS